MKLLLLAAVTVGGAFGAASATTESIDGGSMVVTIEVEVVESAQSVVAHLSFDDDPPLTIPMLNRGAGTFGVTTELENKNYAVVFETIGPDGATSAPYLLSQLGADLGADAAQPTTSTTIEDDISPENRQMLWLAVAAGAASLSLLAFWVLGPKDDDQELDTAGDEEE